MQLCRRFNKYVSAKSLFLDLSLFCVGFFDSANCGSTYEVYSIDNLPQFFYSCKTRNIGLAGKRPEDDVNLQHATKLLQKSPSTWEFS